MPCYVHVLVIVSFLIQYRHMLLVCFLSFPVIFALSQMVKLGDYIVRWTYILDILLNFLSEITSHHNCNLYLFVRKNILLILLSYLRIELPWTTTFSSVPIICFAFQVCIDLRNLLIIMSFVYYYQ